MFRQIIKKVIVLRKKLHPDVLMDKRVIAHSPKIKGYQVEEKF